MAASSSASSRSSSVITFFVTKPPRDEKLQGEKPKQKLPDELRAESTQRPDHEGIQGGRRRGRNHRHSGNRDRFLVPAAGKLMGAEGITTARPRST